MLILSRCIHWQSRDLQIFLIIQKVNGFLIGANIAVIRNFLQNVLNNQISQYVYDFLTRALNQLARIPVNQHPIRAAQEGLNATGLGRPKKFLNPGVMHAQRNEKDNLYNLSINKAG
jgi:hypothetical protein